MLKVLVPFTTGVEEIEFVTIVDILRRADVTVCTASLGGKNVKGRSNITLQADAALADMLHSEWDMIVLPGGMPNAQILHDYEGIKSLVIHHHQQQKWLAAICAAPTILAAFGISKGLRITSHPSVAKNILQLEPASIYVHESVVEDKHIITSRGAGTSLAFSLKLVEKLRGEAKAHDIRTVIMAKEVPITS